MRLPSLENLITCMCPAPPPLSTTHTWRSGSYGLMYAWWGSVRIESHCVHCSTISPSPFATTMKLVRRSLPSRGCDRSAGQSPRVTTMIRSA